MSEVAQSSLSKEAGGLAYWGAIGFGLGIGANSLQIPTTLCLVLMLPVGWGIAKLGNGFRSGLTAVIAAAFTYVYLAPAILGSVH